MEKFDANLRDCLFRRWSFRLTSRATIYTDGPLMQPDNVSIQEFREMQRQLDRPADQRQHEVRLDMMIGLGAVAAGFAFGHFRRRG